MSMVKICYHTDTQEGWSYTLLELPRHFANANAAKICNKFILNRLAPAENPMLSYNQNGFRRGRCTVSQTLSLRCVIEEIKRLNKDLSQQMATRHSLTSRAGVIQGDNLASFLFVIVLDYVLRLSFDSINNQVTGSEIAPSWSPVRLKM